MCSTEDKWREGVPIFKPHGSCDFDISSRAINCSPQDRFRNLFDVNNIVKVKGVVEIVPDNKLLSEPRTVVDIVAPSEAFNKRLIWVRQGYEIMEEIARTVNKCIIVGISYQECDRQEINRIIEKIPENSEIQLIDPNPSKLLLGKLKSISDRVQIIDPDNPANFFDN